MTRLGYVKEAAMNNKTGGNRGRGVREPWLPRQPSPCWPRRAACRRLPRTSGPAGSVTYAQELAFVQCMRSHGVPNFPDPPPGSSITLQVPQNGAGGKPSDPATQALDACKHLLPRGRETTKIQIG